VFHFHREFHFRQEWDSQPRQCEPKIQEHLRKSRSREILRRERQKRGALSCVSLKYALIRQLLAHMAILASCSRALYLLTGTY
jgi:hypothetical protein